MSTAPEFLPMTEEDLGWVVEVETDLHAFPWTRGNFQDSLDAGYGCWVMLAPDPEDQHRRAPAAYAVMLLVLDEAHLLNITVSRSRQRQGLATSLLRFLFEQARTRGATQMFLEVRPSNGAALSLYRRYRFQPIGRRNRYYPAPDGQREDAIVMRREL